jgi:hypothetical protein
MTTRPPTRPPVRPNYSSRPTKDRGIALVIEILPGLFGLLGFGWIYAGNTTAGILWLGGVLVWDIIVILLSMLTAGLICFISVPINLVLVAVSASLLNSYTKQHPELFGR